MGGAQGTLGGDAWLVGFGRASWAGMVHGNVSTLVRRVNFLPAHTGRSREVERGQKYKALILSSRLPRDGSRLLAGRAGARAVARRTRHESALVSPCHARHARSDRLRRLRLALTSSSSSWARLWARWPPWQADRAPPRRLRRTAPAEAPYQRSVSPGARVRSR